MSIHNIFVIKDRDVNILFPEMQTDFPKQIKTLTH